MRRWAPTIPAISPRNQTRGSVEETPGGGDVSTKDPWVALRPGSFSTLWGGSNSQQTDSKGQWSGQWAPQCLSRCTKESAAASCNTPQGVARKGTWTHRHTEPSMGRRTQSAGSFPHGFANRPKRRPPKPTMEYSSESTGNHGVREHHDTVPTVGARTQSAGSRGRRKATP